METEYINITYQGKKEKILKYITESKLQFNKRIEYIKLLEKAGVTWTEANRISKVWYSITFRDCKYSSDLYNKVMSYQK
jgi:uncharacterized lipoprotein YehR (DUF1307 family)